MDNAVKFTLDGSVEFSYLLENQNIVFKSKIQALDKHRNLGRILKNSGRNLMVIIVRLKDLG